MGQTLASHEPHSSSSNPPHRPTPPPISRIPRARPLIPSLLYATPPWRRRSWSSQRPWRRASSSASLSAAPHDLWDVPAASDPAVVAYDEFVAEAARPALRPMASSASPLPSLPRPKMEARRSAEGSFFGRERLRLWVVVDSYTDGDNDQKMREYASWRFLICLMDVAAAGINSQKIIFDSSQLLRFLLWDCLDELSFVRFLLKDVDGGQLTAGRTAALHCI